FGRWYDRQQVRVAPFEMSEQQGTVLIEHVSARAEVARGPASSVRIPLTGDGRPIEPPAAYVRRLAILGQQAEASRVALRNVQDRVREYLKYAVGRIGQRAHQIYQRAVFLFIIRRPRWAVLQLLGAQDRLQRSRRNGTLERNLSVCFSRVGHRPPPTR